MPVVALAVLAAASVAARAQVSLRTVVELAQSNSSPVKLAQADLQKAESGLAESRDAFVPALSFGSGLPAFPEVGFTGSLPTIWDANVQSMVFSMPQIRYIQAAKMGVKAAKLALADAREQVALDASTAYVELDAIGQELAAGHEQEGFASRMVEIEQQRVDGGVDPKSNLYQAQLAAAEVKLHRLHLETRAATLEKQLSTLTGLPVGSIAPDHASIPEIPAVTAEEPAKETPGLESAEMIAQSRERVQKGDEERKWLLPEVGFGAIYNRNTTLLNSVNQYFNGKFLPANNFSSGFSIRLPIFNFEDRDKARESAADALRARVEAEQAQHQNDIQIAQLSGSLRELDTLAQIATLKQEIAAEQLNSISAQLELGNGTSGANAQPQLSPEAEQQARVDERQKYIDALDAGLDLSKARLDLLRALGHMQDWLNELGTKYYVTSRHIRGIHRNGKIKGMSTPLKTLFLNPPSFKNFDGGASSRWPATREIESYWYPVWLTYPAGLLEGSRLLDAPPHHVSAKETIEICKSFEFLVLFTSTVGWEGDQRLAETIKAANPAIKIAFVGPPVTTDPDRALNECSALDFICRREFDFSVVEFAKGKPLNEILGISYKQDGKIRSQPRPTAGRRPGRNALGH